LTRGELIARVERRLAAAPLCYGHGTDNPHDEAAWLVLRGLGLPFDADLHAPVAPASARKIEQLTARRVAERTPVAYLLQEAWLAGVPFYVDERVIVPRSHIAGLLPSLQKRFSRARRVLDLCTGSGCLAVLAARAFRTASVDAVDISPQALAVAEKNIARQRLGRRVRPLRSDLFASLDGRYDLIISNPPYVAAPAMAVLPPEYRHEPRVALAGGADGLDLVARILAQAQAHLVPGGALVCEVGESHPAARRRFRALKLEWLQAEVFVYAPAVGR
jgi:ribosomal protein L3 glutamine methyltransferase